MSKNRTQVAEELALAAIVFTRRARREGHANVITTMTIQEMAEVRGYNGDRYSVRTARSIITRDCIQQDEACLLGFST